MERIVYDTGEILKKAARMEKKLLDFSKKRRQVEVLVNKKIPSHTKDPQIQQYQKNYAEFDESNQELEKQIKSYISVMRSAADKIARTVRGLDI